MNLKNKLGRERERIINQIIVFCEEEYFVTYLSVLEEKGFDISHYNNTYKKAKEYLNIKLAERLKR